MTTDLQRIYEVASQHSDLSDAEVAETINTPRQIGTQYAAVSLRDALACIPIAHRKAFRGCELYATLVDLGALEFGPGSDGAALIADALATEALTSDEAAAIAAAGEVPVMQSLAQEWAMSCEITADDVAAAREASL